jgi:two-component system, NarL family, sensor histidine kinase UhpB
MKTPTSGHRARRDFAIVCAVTGIFSWASVQFDLSESLFRWTHAREWMQLDELPQITVVLSVMLVWFSWRRILELQSELLRRRQAEVRLAEALSENRRLGQQAVELQESERRTLAREIHDELGQYLVAIRLDAASVRRASGSDRRLAEDAAASIARHVDHVQAAVKQIIGRLRPAGLDELGLAAALESCIETWQARLPHTRIVLQMNGHLDDLGEEASLALFRLTQECLTNVLRHAQAKAVNLELLDETLESGARAVRFSAKDDGVGANLAGARRGFGLAGMRERVLALGGQFDIRSRPGSGFEVRATVIVPSKPKEGSLNESHTDDRG